MATSTAAKLKIHSIARDISPTPMPHVLVFQSKTAAVEITDISGHLTFEVSGSSLVIRSDGVAAYAFAAGQWLTVNIPPI